MMISYGLWTKVEVKLKLKKRFERQPFVNANCMKQQIDKPALLWNDCWKAGQQLIATSGDLQNSELPPGGKQSWYMFLAYRHVLI